MGKHETYTDGEKMDFNDFLDFRDYATKTALDTAAAGWGSAEVGRICWCIEENRYYYWDGSVLIKFPSTGGAGAPVDATYVTIGAEPGLNNEVLHKDIAEANRHTPKTHTHVEADVTDLDHDAQKIKGKTVDDAAIGDNKVLAYKTGSGKIEYITIGGGGDMTKAVYDANDDGVVEDSDKLEASTKAQVQDHTPKVHKDSHKTGQSDALLVTDLLDALARVEVKQGGVSKGKRRAINLIAGNRIAYNITDDAGNEEVDVNISVSGGATYKLRPKVTVYKVGSYYYAMDEDGVLVDSGTDATTVIASAIGDLTGARNWLEQVTLKGNFPLDESGSSGYCISLPSFTVLDLTQARLYLNDSQDCNVVHVAGGPSWILGGVINGNDANNATGHCINVAAARTFVFKTALEDAPQDGLSIATGIRGGKFHHLRIENANRRAISILNDATDLEFIDPMIKSWPRGTTDVGIYWNGASNLLNSCHMYGCVIGVDIAPANSVMRPILLGAKIYESTQHGIYCGGANHSVYHGIFDIHGWGNSYGNANQYSDFFVDLDAPYVFQYNTVRLNSDAEYSSVSYAKYGLEWLARDDYCSITGCCLRNHLTGAATLSGGNHGKAGNVPTI